MALEQLPPDSEYVTVKDGYLSRNGSRVRFWGAITNMPRANMPDADIVAHVKRLKDLGFNLFRDYWQSQVDFGFNHDYSKGDGSLSDRNDFLLATLTKEGFAVWGSTLNNVGHATAADVSIINDPATADAWRQTIASQGTDKRWEGTFDGMRIACLARIWDPRLHALGIARMKERADHVNHYTGLRVADDPMFALWELHNEEWWFGRMMGGQFTQLPEFFQKELYDRWNAFLKKKYGAEQRLKDAWLGLLPGESLDKGTVLLLPLRSDVSSGPQRLALGAGHSAGIDQKYGPDDFNRTRGGDVIEFLLGLVIQHKKAENDSVASWGKSMRLAPKIWDTGIGYELPQQYLQQHADAIAHCTYISGFHHDPTSQRFPWFSGLEEPPRMAWNDPWIEHNRMEGKPYLVYEIQMTNPSKYRTEFPMRVASLGAIQDWDCVNWHIFGPVHNSSEKRPYDKAMDYDASFIEHPQGLHYQHDEVQSSAMRAAAEIFKHDLLAPAPHPTMFIFGRKSLYTMRMIDYAGIGKDFMPTTYRYGMRLLIDPLRDGDEIIGPVVHSRVYESNPVRPTDEITYDWHRGYLLFDAPAVAMYTGFFAQYGSPSVAFKNGVVVRDIVIHNAPGIAYPVKDDEKYVEVTVVSADGLPLARCTSAVVSAASTSFNTGFKLDESKLRGEFVWCQEQNRGATVSVGQAPVLVARVGATIELPMLKGMGYVERDWNMEKIGEGRLTDGVLRISADKKIFYIELKRMPAP